MLIPTTVRVVAETAELAALAAELPHVDAEVAADRAVALRQADAVLVGPGSWHRVRGWRAAGVRAGVVLCTDGPPPDDRARMEPVALLRTRTSAALAVALERLDQGQALGRLALACGTVDLDRGRLRRRDGTDIALSTLETRLLGYLAARAGRAIGRDELQLQVWDHRKPVPTRAVDMAVSRLRKKLEPGAAQPSVLVTVRHGGYRLLPAPPALPALPETANPLVGRTPLVEALCARLAEGGAAVLRGPVGIGKTAVAVAAARALAERGVRELVYADVGGAGTLEAALATLARAALAEPPPAGAPQERVASALRELAGVPRVVVLDHVEDCLVLADTLGRVPLPEGLTLLVASRAAVAGLPRIDVPRLDASAADALLRSAAQREGLDGTDTLALEVGGSPMGLELVARAMRTLGPDAVATADAPLDALAGPAGRHRDLREAVAATWGDLDEPAQALLTRLATFRAPFSLSEARALVGQPIDVDWRTLEAAGAVVPDGEAWSVPWPLPAAARAAHPAGWEAARIAHVAWVVRRLEDWLPPHVGTSDAGDRAALRARRNDLAQAQTTALDTHLRWAVGALADALDRLDAEDGTDRDRLARLERALPVATGHAPAEARVRYLRGLLMWNRDQAEARSDLRAAAALAADPDLRARAGMKAAGLTWLLDGAEAAHAEVAAIDTAGLSEVAALRLEADRLVVREATSRGTERGSAARLVVLMEELALRDALHDAVRVGTQALVRYRPTREGSRLGLARRLGAWSGALCDPRLQGHALVHLGEIEGLDGDAAAGDDAFERAEALFARADPARVWQVRATRAYVCVDRGDPDAWARLEQYGAWAAHRGAVTNEVDALLWQCSVAADTDRFELCRTCAERAEERAAAHGLGHFRTWGRLWRATAIALEGGTGAPEVDPSTLTGLGRVQLEAVRVALGAEQTDLDALCAHDGSVLAAMREVVATARRGGDLEPWIRGASGPPSVTVRVVARLLGL